MAGDILSEVLSSPNSLGIVALISVRPRTQSELAELTGISIPGVLKHLKRLEKLGLIKGKSLPKEFFTVRRVYVTNTTSIGDFSLDDFRVVKLRREPEPSLPSEAPLSSLEALAEDMILQKRRIREQVKRLGRMADDLLEDQRTLSRMAEKSGTGAAGSLILQTVFTEEVIAEAERVLVRHFGLKGGRRSIDRAMAETRRIAKK